MDRVTTSKILAFTVVAGLPFSGVCGAQDLEPRRYVHLPIGQNFLGLAYSYSEGEVSVAPSIPLEDAELRVDGPALAYIRTFDFAGNSASFDLLQPYACVSGSALLDGMPVSGQTCGLADTQLRVSYNFIGAPALNINGFVKHPRQVVVGASIQVSIPGGAYDNPRLVNIGANRWYVKPEIGVTIPWHKWSFEFAAGVRFFTDNDEFLETATLEQDPLYNLQVHANHDFSRRLSVSISSNYFFGGRTFRDGVLSAISQENSRLGASWTYALNSRHIIKLIANTGVITRIGNDSNAFTLAWSYRWD